MKDSIRYRNTSGTDSESGIALIIALICLFVITTLSVGVMFSTQSEIWTTSNYTATTQARYVAEAGVQQALNYVQGTYTPPTAFTTTGQTTFNLNGVPVVTTSTATPANALLILSTSGFTGTQYADTYSTIDSTQDSTFQSTFGSSMTQTPFASIVSGGNSAKFDVALQLLTAVKDSDGKWLMRWKIVSQGTLNTLGTSASGGAANPKARVQVVEVIDNVISYGSSSSGSAPSYDAGVFATGTGCNTIVFNGGQYTNSYNSTTQPGVTSPTLSNTGGDVGSFGNISVTSGAYIYGNVFSPFYNVGANGSYGISGGPSAGKNPPACSTGTGGTEYSVNEDNSGSQVGCSIVSGSTTCTQKTYPLPSPAPSFPTPVMPSVATNTAACTGYNGLCNGGSGGGSGCSITIPPSTLPNGTAGTGAANFGAVNFGSCAVITLQAGTYNMDSLLVSNGAQVILPATGSVVINILDKGSTTDPLNINGGTVANNGGTPGNLTFVYAGTKPINVDAGANMFGTVYAPNAAAAISGNAGIYGAVVAKTVAFSGSGHVVYDTSLAGKSWNVNTGATVTPITGNLHVDEFSWSAF
jgi:Tfp pilus assembly protein PilX